MSKLTPFIGGLFLFFPLIAILQSYEWLAAPSSCGVSIALRTSIYTLGRDVEQHSAVSDFIR